MWILWIFFYLTHDLKLRLLSFNDMALFFDQSQVIHYIVSTKLMLIGSLLVLAMSNMAFAQFGNIFEQMFRQQQGDARNEIHRDSNWLEHQYDSSTLQTIIHSPLYMR